MIGRSYSNRIISAAIFSQALSSFTNFAYNFYLLQTMVPEDFGLFSIGMAIVMFLNGFGYGFFIVQYVVLAPSETDALFPARVYTVMIFASLLAAVLAIVLAAISELLAGIGFIVLGVLASAIGYSIKEFLVRHAFYLGKGKRAVGIHLLMTLALFVILTILHVSEVELGADTAFIVYAIVITITSLGAHLVSGLTLRGHSFNSLRSTLGMLAVGGKWAILTNVIFALRGNAHTFIVAGLLGPTAVARVNAARLFLTPPIMLLPAMSAVTLPRLSRAFATGNVSALIRAQTQIAALTLLAALLYSVTLILIWPHLETLLLGENYHDLSSLIVAWSAFSIMLVLRSVVDWGAQAERRFELISKASGGAAIVAIAAAWVLTQALGPIGAVLAVALAELALAATLWATRLKIN